MLGVSCEYVSEFAKDKVYEENETVVRHQEYVFGKQSFKIDRVAGKVDVIITDSPLILSALYNNDDSLGEHFNDVVVHKFNTYDNYNYLLTRQHKYEDNGRFQNQNEEQSKQLRSNLEFLLNKYNIKFSTIDSNIENYNTIVNEIERKIHNEQ